MLNALECRQALLKVKTDTKLSSKEKRDKVQGILYEFLVSNGYPVVAQMLYYEILKEVDSPDIVDGIRIKNPNATAEDQCFECPDKDTERCNPNQCKVGD